MPTQPNFGIEANSQEKTTTAGLATGNKESEKSIAQDDFNDDDKDVVEPTYKPSTVTQYKSDEVLFIPETAPIPKVKVSASNLADE